MNTPAQKQKLRMDAFYDSKILEIREIRENQQLQKAAGDLITKQKKAAAIERVRAFETRIEENELLQKRCRETIYSCYLILGGAALSSFILLMGA